MKKDTIKKILMYTVLVVTTISVLYPLIFIFLGSLKTNQEIYINPFGLPSKFNFKVYYEVLVEKGFARNILNSLYYATATTLLSATICFFAAYAVVRMKWKFSKVFYALLLVGIIVPTNSMILPLYVITNKLGLSDPRYTLVGVYTAFSIPRTIFILAAFLKDLNISIEEAAVIDGCNIWQVMRRVVLPVIKPAMATISIFNFLQVWNDLLMSLIFVSDTKLMTIQTALMKFQGIYETNYPVMLTGVTIVIIPMMLVYIFFQKQVINGMTAGSVKG